MAEKNSCNNDSDQLADNVKNIEQTVNFSIRKELEAICNSYLEKATQELRSQIAQLQNDINYKEQQYKNNNVVISGLPETENENTIHYVLTIGAKLNVSIDCRDIDYAIRGGKFNPSTKKPRFINVRFTTRGKRDEFLKAAWNRDGVKVMSNEIIASDGSTINYAHRVFINEQLTKYNLHLKLKTRTAAWAHGYKFVWTRNGNVYVRKAKGYAGVAIENEECLFRLFPPTERQAAASTST